MLRRNFLTGTATVGAAGLALAACSTFKNLTTPQAIVQQVLNDAGIIANGLANVVPAIQGVPANIVTVLTDAAKDAETAASDLSATMTSNVAQPLVARIEGDVQTFVKDLAAFATSPTVQSIMSDIQIVLPLLVTAVGLALPAGVAKVASVADVAAARARLAVLPNVK